MVGGDPVQNATIARRILDGESGARRDIVLLNSAAAIRAAGRAPQWADGLELAAQAIDSGRAREVLEIWAEVSQSAAAA
jgi:anthranilate phosphoribosyltransferase